MSQNGYEISKQYMASVLHILATTKSTQKKIKTCRKTAADLCQIFLQSSHDRNIVHQCSISSHIQDDSQHIVLQINLFIKHVITVIIVLVPSPPTAVAATGNNNTGCPTYMCRPCCLVCVFFFLFYIPTLIFQMAER